MYAPLDLDAAIREARIRLRAQNRPTGSLDVYRAVLRIRQEQFRTMREMPADELDEQKEKDDERTGAGEPAGGAERATRRD